MKSEDKDATIADIYRIREQIAAKFGGDLNAIVAHARANRPVRMTKQPSAFVPSDAPANRYSGPCNCSVCAKFSPH